MQSNNLMSCGLFRPLDLQCHCILRLGFQLFNNKSRWLLSGRLVLASMRLDQRQLRRLLCKSNSLQNVSPGTGHICRLLAAPINP